MHARHWFLSCMSILIAALCLAVLMLSLESGKVEAQAASQSVLPARSAGVGEEEGTHGSLVPAGANRPQERGTGASPPFEGEYHYPVAVSAETSGNWRDHIEEEGAILGAPDGVGLYAWHLVGATGGLGYITLDFGGYIEPGWRVQVRHRNPKAPGYWSVFRFTHLQYSIDGVDWESYGEWRTQNTADWVWDQWVPSDGGPAARYIRLEFDFENGLGVPAGEVIEGYIDTVRLSGTLTYDPVPADQTHSEAECPFGSTAHYQHWVGGPINTRTGNYHYGREHLLLSAPGEALRFELSYNSQAAALYTTPLGYGWTHNYGVNLTLPNDPGGEQGVVIVRGCRGSRFRFEDNGDGTYEGWPGVWATLTRTLSAPYTYTLTGVDQSIYIFDNGGQLTVIRSPQGRETRLLYDEGRLVWVKDETGERFLLFSYDGQGRLVEVRDPLSRTVRYGYDVAGDLVVVTDTRGLVWTYVYTGVHLLYEIRDPLGRVVERTEYDGERRAVRQWDGLLGEPLQIEYGASGVVTVTDGLGRVTVDGYNGYGVLAFQRDGAGTSWRTYDERLNWSATGDANGNETRYVYNRMGQPERVEGPLGNVTRMAYDGLGHLTVVTDALGQVTRYEYEGNLLITTTDALGGVVVNSYDERGLLVRVVDHGVTTTYGYDELGQRVATTDALGNVTTYGYDGAGRLITVTEYATRTTVNEYDAADNLIRVTENYLPGYPQNRQNEYNLVTEYGYDAVENLVAVTDTVGRVTRYEYDAANRLVRTIENYLPGYPQNWRDEYNIVTEYGYDGVGNQTHITDTLGRVTRNWYDEADRLIRTTVNYSPTVGANHGSEWNITTWYGYDGVGNRVAVTNTLGYVTRYTYDALNRLIGVSDPLSGTRGYGYDALGRQTVVTDADGVAAHSAYDALGRLAETCDALGNCTRYGYDGLGNRTVMTDGNGVVTRYEYDLLSRLTAVVENYRPGELADHRTNVRTEYGYDALGNRTVITDANGHAAHYEYDLPGRLVAESDPLNHTTRYGYDPLGNRTVITDAGGGVTQYTYDGLGRLTAVQYPTATVTYAYDPLGHRVAMTDATGVTTYVYDALGRPITITSPFAGEVGYRYDAVGNRTRLVYPGGQAVTYTYDAAGRLIRIEDWEGGVTRHFYDPAGRLLTMTLPNGVTTTYGYDGAGRLVNLTHGGRYWVLAAYTYTLDGVGNRIGVEERVLGPALPDYLPLAMRGYEGGGGTLGSEGGESAPGSLPQPFLSPLRRLGPEPFASPLGPEASSGPVGAGLVFGDPLLLLLAPLALAGIARRKGGRWTGPVAGGLLVVGMVAVGASLAWGAVPAAAEGTQWPLPSPGGVRTITYEYDPLYRLTGADYSTGERYDYTYDAVGNRLTYSGPDGSHTYTYDAADRLTGVDGVAYTWDERGNQTSDGTLTYEYNAANRLVGVSGGGVAVAYGYDGDGLRVSRTANGQTTHYTWDVAAGLPQLLTDGEALYVPGVGQYRDGEWTYYLADGLGSVRQLADGQGYIVQRYDYSPFGRVVAAEGGQADPLQYTGEQWDGDAGLLYLRARWYDPTTGRFLTRDPFPGLAALPQTQHPYIYVHNNPINLTDPGGEIAPIIAIPLIVAGAALIFDWGVQVYQNVCTRDMSFWDAVYYRNLDWNEMATVGVTAAGTTVMVLGGAQMVLAGGSLLLWQVGIWAQSPTAMQWGDTLNVWTAQCSAWLWSSQTTLDRLQRAATQANRAVPGSGAVVGTRRHTAFRETINSWNNPRLRTEVSFFGRGEVGYGTAGSVRLDVVEYDAALNIIAIYDYKTGNATLTAARVAQIRAQLPWNAQNVPIIVVRGR